MNYVRSEQAKTHQGAIPLVQMLCISDMLPKFPAPLPHLGEILIGWVQRYSFCVSICATRRLRQQPSAVSRQP
ncbi:MAG: hypothetical protein F6K55_24505 [Moorea sp. SIO4A3]|nr:hypothetical protein [Moorena sp. SIO4A3]NEQ81474.1 hypothetical protein [Moorena sp. SIO2I5]